MLPSAEVVDPTAPERSGVPACNSGVGTPNPRTPPDTSGAAPAEGGGASSSRAGADSPDHDSHTATVETHRNCAARAPRITRRHTASVLEPPTASALGGRDDEGVQPSNGLPEQPLAACTADALHERAARIVLGDGDVPKRSGDRPAALEATVAFVLAVKTAVSDLWKARMDEIKARCRPSLPPPGLIDEQEVFGYVLADALGRPLLPHEAARDVGQAGDNAVASANGSGHGSRRRKGKLERARDTAREALRAAQRAADRDAALQPRVAAATGCFGPFTVTDDRQGFGAIKNRPAQA